MSAATFLPVFPYTRDSIESQTSKDPINLVYVGDLARASTVVEMTREVLGCRTDKFVGDQYFYEPLSPVIAHRQDFNQTDAWFSGVFGRFHTRIYQVFTEDARIGRFVASPIHIDKFTLCGDAADSFDLARDWAVAQLRAAGFARAYLPLADPDSVRQCDGRLTPWDGRVAVIGAGAFMSSLGLDTS